MSSDDDYEQESDRKRRRVGRACDFCRRRKIRCDGSQMAGNKCTSCLNAEIDCTYVETPVKYTPQSYVDSLEARLDHSEALVRQLRNELANIHFASTSNTTPKHSLNSSTETVEENVGGSEQVDLLNVSLAAMRDTLRAIAAPPPPPHADDLLHLELAEKFQNISLDPPHSHPFVGKSSGAVLINAAIEMRADVKREEALGQSLNGQIRGDITDVGAWTSRRCQYWTPRPWGNHTRRRTSGARSTCPFKFPSDILMNQLIDLYFVHQNIYLPLLHRPTFERGIAEGLHLRNDDFGTTVLLVCAIGSRWSTDPEVAEKGITCGWEWFDQVSDPGISIGRAKLYDLQYYCLAVQFLSGSAGPQGCWTLVGVGLRLAQDIGAHRRKARIEVPTVESELYKRAFWVLVCQDRTLSAGVGRPCALQYEDFDLDLPLQVDDEYWDHPTHPFQQPAGKPSVIAAFNRLIHLNHILAYSLKTLYSINKVRWLFPVYDRWEEHAVPELDSALNNWHEQIPDHLRWDPTRKDPVFFAQSVALHCWYHSLQILIHRPFIPMLGGSTPMALPSLAICTSAARACANMVDVQRQRTGNVPVIAHLPSVFISGIVLLLNVWSGKRSGLVPDPRREIANVYKCMEAVRLCEGRWQIAGAMWDILAELASVGQLTLTHSLSNYNATIGTEYEHRQQNNHADLTTAGSVLDRCIQAQFSAQRAPVTPSGMDSRSPGTEYMMEASTFAPSPVPDTWFLADNTLADMYKDPVQATSELGDMIDRETIAMWSAPMSLQVDDWGTFFSNFNDMTQTPADTETNGHHIL
ncbi:fungal-specific transcription factor domain-containing protein [Mycena olivaceomarginata]|nr:fungal-specific transcription factor domain-containing protein [Mycena olivaceomarginata]